MDELEVYFPACLPGGPPPRAGCGGIEIIGSRCRGSLWEQARSPGEPAGGVLAQAQLATGGRANLLWGPIISNVRVQAREALDEIQGRPSTASEMLSSDVTSKRLRCRIKDG